MWEYYKLVNMYENDGVTAMTLKGDLEWVREKEIGLFGWRRMPPKVQMPLYHN